MSSSDPLPEMRSAKVGQRPVPRPPAVPLQFARVLATQPAQPNTAASPVPTPRPAESKSGASSAPSPATIAKKQQPKRTPSPAARQACRRKVRYSDEIQAKLILSQTGGGRHTRRGKDEKRAYPCPVCLGWHLTSREAWQPRRNPDAPQQPTPPEPRNTRHAT